jgi:hypothetical protein
VTSSVEEIRVECPGCGRESTTGRAAASTSTSTTSTMTMCASVRRRRPLLRLRGRPRLARRKGRQSWKIGSAKACAVSSVRARQRPGVVRRDVRVCLGGGYRGERHRRIVAAAGWSGNGLNTGLLAENPRTPPGCLPAGRAGEQRAHVERRCMRACRE